MVEVGGGSARLPAAHRPAFYAAAGGSWRAWWTVLHPPYTAWHLAYVVIGASLAPEVDAGRLIATLLAFFLAVGVAAHALDELHGRPLQTTLPAPALAVAVVLGLVGAVGLGIAGVLQVGWVLVPFIVVGPLLVVAYDAELFGGVIHTDLGFAASWGGFPVLTGYVAQAGTLRLAPVLAAAGAIALSAAQRSLSTPARTVRRSVYRMGGTMTMRDGRVRSFDEQLVLQPIERALRASAWAVTLLAAALAVARLT